LHFFLLGAEHSKGNAASFARRSHHAVKFAGLGVIGMNKLLKTKIKPWAINDSKLKSGVYYHNGINAIAIVSNSNWYLVGAKQYPLDNWERIGEL